MDLPTWSFIASSVIHTSRVSFDSFTQIELSRIFPQSNAKLFN